jgi:hypothetical protein
LKNRKIAAFIYRQNGHRIENLTVCQLDACSFQVSYDVEIGHNLPVLRDNKTTPDDLAGICLALNDYN